MKYSINIDQLAFVRYCPGLDLKDASIFDFIRNFFPVMNHKVDQVTGKIYFRVDYQYIADQMPLLQITTADGIYRRFRKMNAVGLFEPHPDNQTKAEKGEVWYCFGPVYPKVISSRETPVNPSDNRPTPPTDNGPDPFGQPSGPLRTDDRTPSDGYPTDNSIIDNRISDSNSVYTAREEIKNEAEEQQTDTSSPISQSVTEKQVPPPAAGAAAVAEAVTFEIGADEKAAGEIITFLSAHAGFLSSFPEGDWKAAVKNHCTKLLRDGQFYELTIPEDMGRRQAWLAKRIAGAKSWLTSFNSNEARRVKPATIVRGQQAEPVKYTPPVRLSARGETSPAGQLVTTEEVEAAYNRFKSRLA